MYSHYHSEPLACVHGHNHGFINTRQIVNYGYANEHMSSVDKGGEDTP